MPPDLSARLMKKAPDGVRRAVRAYQSWSIAKSPFFSRYPYHGRLGLHAVDWHTAVDLDFGVLFHRIPKVANSSLVASVQSLKSGEEPVTGQAAKRTLRQALVQPSALGADEVERIDRLFKFLIVRNPYDRVLSGYLSKVVAREEEGRRPKSRPWRGSGATLADGASFEQFCRYLAEGGLYTNYHWAPQSDFLTFALANYDFVGRLETIGRDFRELSRRIKGPGFEAAMVEEDPLHATGASSKRSRYYTPALYALVYDIYRQDFDSFGYQRC
jgi:hypothetical protein